jgi:hypothetical protein
LAKYCLDILEIEIRVKNNQNIEKALFVAFLVVCLIAGYFYGKASRLDIR